MWIVTNKGFMSIVAKDVQGRPSAGGLDAIVSVRFRRPKDAEALFPGHPVVITKGGDYACRVFVTRAEVAEVVFKLTVGVDYTNFKSSIIGDPALSTAAHKGWDVFGTLQDGGPYGTKRAALPSNGTNDRYDDLFDRYGVKDVAPAKPKHHRNDPFCDACGMRVGAKHLDGFGECLECAMIHGDAEGHPDYDECAAINVACIEAASIGKKRKK